jgi:hypothetical protein
MGPAIMMGIILAAVVLVAILLWQTFKTLQNFSQSLWHFFKDE